VKLLYSIEHSLAADEQSEILESALHDTTFCRPHGDPGGCGTALQVGRLLVRLPLVLFEFFIDLILPVLGG